MASNHHRVGLQEIELYSDLFLDAADMFADPIRSGKKTKLDVYQVLLTALEVGCRVIRNLIDLQTKYIKT